MKKIIYILLIIFISALGFFIVKSGDTESNTYSVQQVSVYQGVDFSKFTLQYRNGNTRKPSNNIVTKSLIPESDRPTSGNIKRTGEYNFDYRTSKKTQKKQSSILNGLDNNASSNIGSGTYYTSLTKNKNVSANNNALMPVGINGRHSNERQSTSSGLLAKGNLPSNSIDNSLMSTQTNPFNDYNDNDITHPGGNPNGNPLGGESIPVGDGTVPFLLFMCTYTLYILLKKNRNAI